MQFPFSYAIITAMILPLVQRYIYTYIHKAKIIGINLFRTEISSPLVAYSVAFLPAYNAPPAR